MTESELPKNLVPPPSNKDVVETEEIVSPVQPAQRKAPANSLFTVVLLLVATFGLGYLVYGQWPKFGQGIKIAKAPETTQEAPTNTTPAAVEPVPPIVPVPVVAPTPAPAPVAVAPEPRISSISTNTPSIATQPAKTQAKAKPKVASASAANKVYTDMNGFTITVPAGAVVNVGDEGGHVVELRNAADVLLLRVEITDFVLDKPDDLGRQLQLSTNVRNLQAVNFSGLPAFKYTVQGVPAMAVIKGNRVYYITDYSGANMHIFALKN